MYNAYGERHLSYVRVPLASIEEGAATAGARLVAVHLWAPDTDALPSELRLVFEHDSFPVVLAGLQIPEVSETAESAPASEPAEPAQPAE